MIDQKILQDCLIRLSALRGCVLVLLQYPDLAESEYEGDRHNAEDFERDPGVGRKEPPHHFVEPREKHEEKRPAKRQDTPSLIGEPHHFAKHDLQEQSPGR